MRDRRLMERLAEAGEGQPARAAAGSEERLLRSVLDHLLQLLNTRRGNAAIDPDYGLPDLSKLVGSALAADGARIETMVRQVLLKYEPRLGEAQVRLLGLSADQMGLRLEIGGRIEHAGRQLPLRIKATVAADGRIELHA